MSLPVYLVGGHLGGVSCFAPPVLLWALLDASPGTDGQSFCGASFIPWVRALGAAAGNPGGQALLSAPLRCVSLWWSSCYPPYTVIIVKFGKIAPKWCVQQQRYQAAAYVHSHLYEVISDCFPEWLHSAALGAEVPVAPHPCRPLAVRWMWNGVSWGMRVAFPWLILFTCSWAIFVCSSVTCLFVAFVHFSIVLGFFIIFRSFLIYFGGPAFVSFLCCKCVFSSVWLVSPSYGAFWWIRVLG